jgi:UDP-glucose 4-epimerase
MSTTLVVGGGGFIGSHLVLKLFESGRKNIRVVGRSAQPRFSLPKEVDYLSGDISNESFIRSALQGCDEVIDLAYSTVPKTSFEDPVHDVLANLPSTVTLIKVASEFNLRRFVLVSSGGTVYGNAAYLPIDEFHLTNPVSPYGITKLAIEKYALMFNHLSSLPIVIVRPGNPYGPNQLGNLGQGFIASAIFSLLNNKQVNIFGERGTVRDYIFIDDLTDGLVAALDKGKVGEVYNIGTGIGLDNREVLDAIVKISDQSKFPLNLVIQSERPFDVAGNVLSSTKLTNISGWKPQISFQSGLKKTWLWATQQGRE